MVRFLGLSRSAEAPTEPGLILVQIDGLSRTQLERGLRRGRLPFLRRLIQGEGYVVRTMYSGLPSTTPSVQGELFYGIRPAVPAFSFLSRRFGRVVKMLEPEPVANIERDLESRGKGLLEGGSVYSNIYTGGAAEAHFCSSTFGWSHAMKAANPFKLAVLGLLNAASLLRTAVLIPVELALAVVDLFRGTIAGENIGKELKFVPTRVLICIMLREVITLGAMMDAARGLPVIHLNYLGYDEQAHRRGPSSEFAHWTLKGIDYSIRRIYEAAQRSNRRIYDVWIYSDHGQEHVTPYPVAQGRTLKEAVEEVLKDISAPTPGQADGEASIRSQRVRYLRAERAGAGETDGPAGPEPGGNGIGEPEVTDFTLAAMGPIGHLNFGRAFDRRRLPEIAARLVEEAGVPAVLVAEGEAHIRAWTPEGVRSLPRDVARVIGEKHPFLKELAVEIGELCRHPDAGDLVLLGYRPDGRAMSFPIETGAHAGPGPEETLAFSMTPPDVELPGEAERDAIRPFDLREAALRHLGRAEAGRPKRPLAVAEPLPATLRVLAYDVGGCLGRDGRVSMSRIARVIARHQPDIVCLQHLEGIGQAGRDQAEAVLKAVTMEMHMLKGMRMEDAKWGDAILSRFPMVALRTERLGGGTWGNGGEGLQEVRVMLGRHAVRVVNVQASAGGRERELQVATLMEGDWLKESEAAGEPVVVCVSGGAAPSRGLRRQLGKRFREAMPGVGEAGRRRGPRGRGRVYVAGGLELVRASSPADDLTRLACELPPLVVELRHGWGAP